MLAAFLPQKTNEQDREFTALTSRYPELELSIARVWTTIDAGIAACGRDGEPAQVMRPTLIVTVALLCVRQTAMGHA